MWDTAVQVQHQVNEHLEYSVPSRPHRFANRKSPNADWKTPIIGANPTILVVVVVMILLNSKPEYRTCPQTQARTDPSTPTPVQSAWKYNASRRRSVSTRHQFEGRPSFPGTRKISPALIATLLVISRPSRSLDARRKLQHRYSSRYFCAIITQVPDGRSCACSQNHVLVTVTVAIGPRLRS